MIMQPSLFDYADEKAKAPAKPPVPVAERNPNLTGEDRQRLSGQNGLILERLKQGPATGPELMRLAGAMNFSARVSNIRAFLKGSGQTVASKRIEGGVWEYSIVNTFSARVDE